MEQLALSFIIPAFNEEALLPHALDSIHKHVPESLSYEIIVADNGSQDMTIHIAMNNGAEVLVDEVATVGGLRNQAVQRAKGKVLVFLDADIMLTEAWGESIVDVYNRLIVDPWQVTGSRCGVSESPGWIERYWFIPLLGKKSKYINSGHLITTAELFRHLGGFDEKIESGEDYAFGQLAAADNATIVNDPLLAVVHEGYPKTLRQFIKREIWHGRGDCKSFHSIKESNVAIAAIAFMVLHVIALVGLFYNPEVGTVMGLLIVSICAVFAIFKHDAMTVNKLLVVSSLYYFYLLSRFLSCIPLIHADSSREKHRNNS